MPRPPKYATAQEAAEANLYSKMGGCLMGLSQPNFISIVTGKCIICGCDPAEELVVNRKDGSYTLKWHYITTGGACCKVCKTLEQHFEIDMIVKHCARIMAKRMHYKRRKRDLDNMFLRASD